MFWWHCKPSFALIAAWISFHRLKMLQKSCSNARQLMYVLNGLPHSFHLSCANSSRGFVIQGSTSRRLMNCGCRRRPQFPCRRRIVFTNIHTHTHTRLFHPVFQSILYTSASIDIHCINADFGSVLELLDIYIYNQNRNRRLWVVFSGRLSLYKQGCFHVSHLAAK